MLISKHKGPAITVPWVDMLKSPRLDYLCSVRVEFLHGVEES